MENRASKRKLPKSMDKDLVPSCESNDTAINSSKSTLKKPYYDVSEKLLSLSRNRYSENHPGPYEIHIEKYMFTGIEEDSVICDLFLGRVLSKIFPEDWQESFDFSALDRQKFFVKSPDKDIANRIVTQLFEKSQRYLRILNGWPMYPIISFIN